LQSSVKELPAVKTFQLGMGDKPGTARLQKTYFSMSHSILPAAAGLNSKAHEKFGEVEIFVTTID
jgi:hypothetical protein